MKSPTNERESNWFVYILILCERERPAWKVPKERQVLLVPKDHLASPVLKASGASLAQL